MPASKCILILDDDRALAEQLAGELEGEYEALLVSTPESALRMLETHDIALILAELDFAGMGGIALVRALQTCQPSATIICHTRDAHIQDAVQALREGVYHYLVKPCPSEDVIATVREAMGYGLVRPGPRRGDEGRRTATSLLVGESPGIRRVRHQIEQVSDTDSTVLIEGETGTGKELVARALHQRSARSAHPFIAVDCAALPGTLMESELFGHEQGAFTNALRSKPGLFEQADGGSLLLDEIGEIPLELQSKLLRVLQERQFRRLGGTKLISVDIRVIAASNRNLTELIQQQAFRPELYYRLSVVRIELPPLRERKEDIPLLVAHFLDQFAEIYGVSLPKIAPAAWSALMGYDWPGNVRQLRNAVESALVMSSGDLILPCHLPRELRESISTEESYSLQRYLETQEKALILRTLIDNQWEIKRTAEQLGMKRSTLYYKLEKYQLLDEKIERQKSDIA